MEYRKLSISTDNRKLGFVPSLSVMPGETCRPGAACLKGCYAVKMMRYPNVANAWKNNTELYKENPDSYFSQFLAALMPVRFFRLHVAGDIIDPEYFSRVCKTAAAAPHCKILMFTKKYEIVNAYIDNGGKIPENLQIIFSNWGNQFRCENPHNLPAAEVVFPGSEINPEWKTCGGDCSACACRGVGCWELKHGETIAFNKH